MYLVVGKVGTWKYGNSEHGYMGIFEYGVWEYGNMGIWEFGAWEFGNLNTCASMTQSLSDNLTQSIK